MTRYLKLLIIAIFASLSFAFVACGDDEDDEPDYEEMPSIPSDDKDEDKPGNGSNDNTANSQYDLVGSWESEVITDIPGLDNSNEKSYTRFYDDGTYVGVNIKEGYDNIIVRGTWSISGNKLTNTTFGITVTYEIVEYSKDSFRVKLGNIDGFIKWVRIDDSVIDKYL